MVEVMKILLGHFDSIWFGGIKTFWDKTLNMKTWYGWKSLWILLIFLVWFVWLKIFQYRQAIYYLRPFHTSSSNKVFTLCKENKSKGKSKQTKVKKRRKQAIKKKNNRDRESRNKAWLWQNHSVIFFKCYSFRIIVTSEEANKLFLDFRFYLILRNKFLNEHVFQWLILLVSALFSC